MVIRPKADETFEIVYTVQDTESWDMYTQTLDKFLSRKSGSQPLLRWKKALDYPGIQNELFLPNQR